MTVKRAFIENGTWNAAAEAACDAIVQKKATLRVSALAGLLTLGLMAGPDIRLALPDAHLPRAPMISQPEMVVYKPADRVPSPGDITSSAPARRRIGPTISDETPGDTSGPKPFAAIEILDSATLRSGDMTVRLAGVNRLPDDQTCRRLDGLTVTCADRATSYLQLLVKGRTVVCDRAGMAEDGVEIGRCRIGDTDISEQLIRQGWAAAVPASDKRLMVAEAAAKVQKLGIWRE
jgi:endonuclease YncB( thermonuclease family)